MKIGFKTTLEKTLVDELKKRAFEKNVYVNEILEDLIEKYLNDNDDRYSDDEIKRQQQKIYSMNYDKKINYISSNLKEALNLSLYNIGIKINTKQSNIIKYICELMARTLLETEEK